MRMEEEKPQEETKEEVKEEEKTQTQTLAMTVEMLKKENDRHEDLLRKQEELTAKNLLSGTSDAASKPQETKEETPAEYAKKVLSGEINRA